MKGPDAASIYRDYLPQVEAFESAAAQFAGRVAKLLEGKVNPIMVSGRHKDPLELYKKQLRKKYSDPWEDCPDIIGVRVIVGTIGSKSEVQRILADADELDVFSIEDQAERADPARIGYLGLHLHVRSTDITVGGGRMPRCEIQVRTTAEHAWCETEHRYIYKKATVPDQIRRHFNRLLVLTELFDAELERGVDMVKELAGFRSLELAHYLESKVSSITGRPTHLGSTIEAVELLSDAGVGTAAELRCVVDEYLHAAPDAFPSLVAEHGPQSDSFDVRRDWILAEGEGLLFAALLNDDPYRLSNALDGTDLYDPVEAIAIHTGSGGFVK